MNMLETRAIIVQTEGQYALVRVSQADGCDHCNGKGCGTGKLSQLFCSKQRQFRVENPINASIGDQVILSVAEGALLRGIGLVYLLPLILLLTGAVYGNYLAVQAEQRDSYSAVGALLGLLAGFVFAKWISSRQGKSHTQPFIARQWRE
jgi:sigma-E factor negative regulatory protein RseC